MRSSVTSAFGEPGAFGLAMRAEGSLHRAVTHPGRFHARLTQVELDRLHLADVEESLPRIAFIKAPDDALLISLWLDGRSSQIWGGVRLHVDGLITCSPGTRVHTCTEGPCHWGVIRFPANDFVQNSRALTGELPRVPQAVCLWRPTNSAARQLRHLYLSAVRAAQTIPESLVASEATHGLEQQLIHAVIECLSGHSEIRNTGTRHELMVRFEELVTKHPGGEMGVAEMSAVLGTSERFLRRCCDEQLGMSPLSYLRLRRLQWVHCALRDGTPDTLSVSTVALRHGFRNLGRFAAAYRDLFGEQPSTTLRRGPHRPVQELAPRRRPAGSRFRHSD